MSPMWLGARVRAAPKLNSQRADGTAGFALSLGFARAADVIANRNNQSIESSVFRGALLWG